MNEKISEIYCDINIDDIVFCSLCDNGIKVCKSYSKLYCNIFTAKNDYNTGSYSYSSNIAVVASHGDTFERSVTRNPSSAVVDYIHCVESYYSSSKLSSTLADKYSYTAMQSIDNNINLKI